MPMYQGWNISTEQSHLCSIMSKQPIKLLSLVEIILLGKCTLDPHHFRQNQVLTKLH